MKLNKQERETLRGMFGGLCAYCGTLLGDRWHADHVERVERKLARVNGRVVCTKESHRPHLDTIDNMMPACPPCNIDKHTLTIEAWRLKLQDACGVLTRNQPTYRHALRFGLVVETKANVVFHFEKIRDQGAAGVAARPDDGGVLP